MLDLRLQARILFYLSDWMFMGKIHQTQDCSFMQISSDLSVSSMVYETQGKESTELILCFFWYYRYLLPDHVGTCHLRISFSAHNDLNVKFQSHRSR
jgi:hypothetical protein